MKTPNRLVMLAPVSTSQTSDFLKEANDVARALDPNPRGDRTFSVSRLSANGEEPASHVGCHGWVTDERRTQFEDFFAKRRDVVPPVQGQYESGGRFEHLPTPAKEKIEEVRDTLIVRWGGEADTTLYEDTLAEFNLHVIRLEFRHD